ncbi:ATP-binding protein [Tessaracoccus sp. MC1679]|uniref:ATP-binding protein n=1 Tax=Tessaracoccus sp. MC1679 TaxID=2760313 RepID=UPI0016016584|nr:ATP-binding protein [Tessaracoccus sp. MC1679]
MDYQPRILDDLLKKRLHSAGAVLIEGPKACGKTRSAERAAASAVYLDRDEAAIRALDVEPGLVLGGPSPRLVDEWQLDGTRLWNHVRAEVDRRGKPGQFILTGSAVPNDDVRRHSGAGRFARLVMRPLTLFESSDSTGAMSLRALLAGERPTSPSDTVTPQHAAELIVRGGWPINLGLSVQDAAAANRDYLRTVAEVDLRQVAGPRRDPARVLRFIQALARNTAMEHVVTKLSAEADGPDISLSRPSAHQYQDALARLMLLEVQPAWSTHLRSRARLRERARTHLVDPSLAAAALDASPAKLLRDLNTLGLLFESLAVRDVRVYAEAADASMYHYRDSDGLEVDIIVESRDGTWGAFEVKLGAGQVDRAAASLLSFAAKVDTVKVGEPAVLGVITAGGYGYTRPDGVVAIPIGALGP